MESDEEVRIRHKKRRIKSPSPPRSPPINMGRSADEILADLKKLLYIKSENNEERDGSSLSKSAEEITTDLKKMLYVTSKNKNLIEKGSFISKSAEEIVTNLKKLLSNSKKKKKTRVNMKKPGKIEVIELSGDDSDFQVEINPVKKFQSSVDLYKKSVATGSVVVKSENLQSYSEKVNDMDFSFMDEIPSQKPSVKVEKASESQIVVKCENLQEYSSDISDIDFGITDEISLENQFIKLEQLSESGTVVNCNNLEQDIGDVSIQNVDKPTKARTLVQLDNLQPYIGDLNDEDFDDDFTSPVPNIAMAPTPPPLPEPKEKYSELPCLVNSKKKDVFRFFYLDAYEDFNRRPGMVFLFGKVYEFSDFVSCCVVVKDVPRKIYFLPRKYILQEDGTSSARPTTSELVDNEIRALMAKLKIQEYRRKEVKKLYVFDRSDVPRYDNYVEVEYSSRCQEVDLKYSGPTIQGVFNTTVRALESFILEKNIKGPCWLDVEVPSKRRVPSDFSWCKIEVQCTKKQVHVTRTNGKFAPTPRIVLATVNVQASLDSTAHRNEIATVGLLIHQNFELEKQAPKQLCTESYCFVTRPKSKTWPSNTCNQYFKDNGVKAYQIFCDSEVDLLEKVLEHLGKYDPDVILSHDSEFQLGLMLNNIGALKINNWSKIGKLKQSTAPKFKDRIYLSQFFCGRPVCDIQLLAKEYRIQSSDYSLASLYRSAFENKDLGLAEIKPEYCCSYYETRGSIQTLIDTTIQHAKAILEVAAKHNILPLTVQLTMIAGNTLSRSMHAGISDKSEHLLLHAFYQNGYIVPETTRIKQDDYHINKRAVAYTGGVVLEPKAGLYDSLILLMDFKSLYPSVIQEFNICFTTIVGSAYADYERISVSDCNVTRGILPYEIRNLVQSRALVKKSMQLKSTTTEAKQQMDIRQKALKLVANSLYGCLGSSHSRFYAKGLAAFVTSKGREVFYKTKDVVETLDHKVIYGDTDSVMIECRTQDHQRVLEIASEIKRKINKTYKHLKIETEQVYKRLLLLKKKQYAALKMIEAEEGKFNYLLEMKGLDHMKRDRSDLASFVGTTVLKIILDEKSAENNYELIFKQLAKVKLQLEKSAVSLSSLEIKKQLTRDPDGYRTKQCVSHVAVAQRLNQTSARKWKSGDIVPYVICRDGTRGTPAERAYHIDELKNNHVKIDFQYYLNQEIYPVIVKICEPVKEIDKTLIAKSLGVQEASKCNNAQKAKNTLPLIMQKNRYQNCEPLKFRCRNQLCNAVIEIRSAMHEFPSGVQPSLAMCSNPECGFKPWTCDYVIINRLQCDIRKFVTRYYANDSQCDNILCSRKSNRINLDSSDQVLMCDNCGDGKIQRLYTESDLLNQLCYFLDMFTLDRKKCEDMNLIVAEELIEVYENIACIMKNQMENNGFGTVDLTELFSSCAKEFYIYAIKDNIDGRSIDK